MSGIRRIIVAGAGPLAWISAAGLHRAFGQRQFEVSVVDTGTSADARIGRWTLPSQRGIHGLLGITESHLVQQTGATFRLATEFVGWQGEGTRFLHAHGDIGVEIGGAAFYKYLQGEGLAGRNSRPEEFSLAGTAARLGRFARPMGESGSLTSSFTYGFHFEDAAYSDYLRAHALRLGVHECPARFAGLSLNEQGAIQALQLADGSRVSADYYVDCSGPDAHLISRVASDGREDWSQWFPCDRMWSSLASGVEVAPAVTQTFATAAGWAWRAPLARASMVGQAFSSHFMDDAAARASLEHLGAVVQGEPRLTRFSPGRRRSFWARNCLALGAAAVELEPLAGADLHLALIGLGTFIELMPLDVASGIESVEYNRVMAEHADAVRDFTLAHYRAGAARAGAFWEATRSAPLPERLAHRLELYASNGRINLQDHESFEETDWAWLLLGCGCLPDTLELQIRTQVGRLAPKDATALRTHVQQLAASMPPHMEFVRRQATSAARPAS
ncbi:MAG TPA: tryptophan halogenase family protein [Steroidobacteraceae bacterium]|nr:tryptophan halogenase family protein [Steroidobacteraceae bacterium]